MDSRLQKLAHTIVSYSLNVQPGDNVLIEHFDSETRFLAEQLVKEVHQAGGNPFIQSNNMKLLRQLIMNATPEMLSTWADIGSHQMKQMDCYVGIRGYNNVNEWADIPADKMSAYFKTTQRPVTDIRVNDTRWVVMRYPNSSMAQLSNTSSEAFEDFYFQVCNLDYSKMSRAMDNLVALMNRTDRVRIVGPGTDLSFSIKDIPAIKCAGQLNIPDGEVFTAPVKNSVNGTLQYNTPSIYQGFTYENIRLRFNDGKIVEASANDTTKINQIFDTDDGARYIGEFAIGVNPYITTPMKDILFDEKIMGSFHFTPGKAYAEADNSNVSSIHWDLVCIQTEEWGGGEIYFDDVLIRKNGIFVIEELKALNPENLK